MYHDYFGLQEPAFSIAVNPKYLFMSSQHKEALAHLVYGVQGGGFVLLSGEVGTGKTTIVRCLLEQMPGDTEIAFVLNPMSDVKGLLITICEEFHIELTNQNNMKVIMDEIQAHLLYNHAEGKRTVLLIDEAQLLSADVLEQIRLLTNLETSTDKLLQIVLVGQPEVNELLSQPRLRQLSQRITARFHLEALNLIETKRYINHRLTVAGKKEGRVIFPDNIIKRIHRFSGGVPRLINILCERLLVGAYGHNRYEIDANIYQRALNEVEGTKPQEAAVATQYPYYTIAAGGAALLIIVILVGLLFKSYSNSDDTPEITTPIVAEYVLDESANPTLSLYNDVNAAVSEKKYYLDNTSAFAKLFAYYEIRLEAENHPCWQTDKHNLSCSKVNVETWQDIADINRPAILTLVTQNKNLAFAVMVGMNETTVLLLDKNGTLIELPKTELAEAWNGALVYLWRKPKGYEKTLTVGSNSSVVAWVAKQFALLDGQSKPITKNVFTTRLETRIKIFQSMNGLEQDGIIGERTLMKLNEQLGLNYTLLDALPSA